MGNKNARGSPALSPPRVTTTQASASAQVMKASSDHIAANNLNRKAASETSAKTEVQPMTLPFRSYQTGTLHTDNFEPSGSTPKKTSNTNKRLSAESPAFVPSTQAVRSFSEPSPTIRKLEELIATINPEKPKYKPYVDMALDITYKTVGPIYQSLTRGDPNRLIGWGTPAPPNTPVLMDRFNVRVDLSKKDIVITASSITHNVVHMQEYCRPGEKPFLLPTVDYHPSCYLFEEEYERMSSDDRVWFWHENWVEIIVNIGDFSTLPGGDRELAEGSSRALQKNLTGVVDRMNDLGDEFTAQAHTVFVNIVFPEQTSPRVPAPADKCIKEQLESPAYQAIQNIADKLKELSSLARLEIVLRTPAHAQPAISIEQLNYALPFYELPFTKWQLKWQNTYMRKSETVRGWSINHLDVQRCKIDRAIEKARREKEEQVFVRPSSYPLVHDLPFAPRAGSPKSKSLSTSKGGN